MRIRVWALLFSLLVLGGGVSAQPLDGQWQSSSGAGISIQTSQQGVTITVTPTTGQAQTWRGQWLRQWDRFTYMANNNEQVTGQAVTGDRIDLTSNKGNRYTWTRLASQPNPQTSYDYAGRLQGRWSSSSGTTIDITLQNGKIYVNAIGANGTRYTGEGRWLDATSFRYGIQGFQDEWVGTFLTDGRIKVIATKSNSKVTYWTKQR